MVRPYNISNMTKVSKDDIQKLADMSRISLTEAECTSLTKDITQLISYVDMLQELDAKDIEPTYSIGTLQNVWREDTVQQNLTSTQLLKATDDRVNEQIKVPKVL